MQRDEFGRFAKGNTLSIGNKGNKRPKWHNKNAVITGVQTNFSGLFALKENLYVIYQNESVAIVDPDYFMTDGSKVYVKEDMVKTLLERFYFPVKWFMDEADQEEYKRYIGGYSPGRPAPIFIHYLAPKTVLTPKTRLDMKELTRRGFKRHLREKKGHY